jgi:sugar transferase EpsL
MGRGVFFKQLRVGHNGKIFLMYKFRTMLNDNGKLSDMERTTKLGYILRKYSLDELPEFINILLGHMSFVGPRPLLVEYLPLYSIEQRKRHHVKPGITGWAQIKGRNLLKWDQKFEYDVWYVENQSLCLDLKIVLLTIKKIIISEGINAEGHATVEPFKG